MRKILFFILLFCSSLQAQQLLYAPVKAGLAGTLFTGQGIGSVPSFSATPTLGIAGTTTGSLSLANSTGSNVITIQAPASPNAYTLKLPTTVGSNTFVLTTDGANPANLTWTTPGAATMAIGSGVTTGTSGSILYVNSSVQLAQDNANLFWDATNHRLGIGNTSPSNPVDIKFADAAAGGSETLLLLRHDASSGTPAAGFGGYIEFQNQTSTTADQLCGRIQCDWGAATHSARQGDMQFILANSSGNGTVLQLTDNTATGIKFSNYGGGILGTNSSGVVSAVNGTAHGIVIAEGAAVPVATAAGTSGQVLTSGGASADPTWVTLVPIANGGTGASTLTNHGVLLGQTTSAIVATAAGTSRQLLTSGGASADPLWTTETYAVPGTSGNIMQSDGTNWTAVGGGWTTVKVAGSDFTTTGQSLVDITGLSFSATASTTYELEAWLDCTTSAVTTGVEFGINSTGTSPTVMMFSSGNSTTSAAVTGGNANNNGAESQAYLTTSSMEGFIHIWAIVKSGTGSPTISIRGLKLTSGTLTVKIGSKLSYRVQ